MMEMKQGPFTDEMRKTVYDGFDDYYIADFGATCFHDPVALYFEKALDNFT